MSDDQSMESDLRTAAEKLRQAAERVEGYLGSSDTVRVGAHLWDASTLEIYQLDQFTDPDGAGYVFVGDVLSERPSTWDSEESDQFPDDLGDSCFLYGGSVAEDQLSEETLERHLTTYVPKESPDKYVDDDVKTVSYDGESYEVVETIAWGDGDVEFVVDEDGHLWASGEDEDIWIGEPWIVSKLHDLLVEVNAREH